MNKKLLQSARGLAFATAFLVVGNSAKAQLAATTYQFTALAGTYTANSGGTAVPTIQGDDISSGSLPIGFTFNYCGTDYTQLKACSNGWLTFNTSNSSSSNFNALTEASSIKAILMPLYDDLNGDAGTASYTLTGTAPNRVFTLEYKNWRWNWSTSFPPTISFQVKLYESTNIIQYVYNQEAGAPTNTGASSGATIGIGDNSTPFAYLSLNNTTATPTASSTTFTDNITNRPATGQIYQFKPLPAIDLSADSIVVNPNFCSNSSSPASLALSNQGTAIINSFQVFWSVDGVAQTPVTYSGAPIAGAGAAPNNTGMVELGNVFYADNTPKVIKAYLYQPNGLPDAVNTNDTVTGSKSANLQGVIVHITPRDTTICNGQTIVLDAGTNHPTNPFYIWNTSKITHSISVSEAGTYSVLVQNSDGCSDRDTVTVSVHPDPVINSIAIIDNTSGTYTFNAIGAQNVTSYTWNFGDGTSPVDNNGTPGQILHQYQVAGDYNVTLTIRNDCGEITVTRRVSTTGPVATGIGDVSVLKAISVFPNPSKDKVTITANAQVKMKSVAVYNILGQQIFATDKVNASKYEFNVAAFSAGIYNVVIDTDAGKITKKLEVIQ